MSFVQKQVAQISNTNPIVPIEFTGQSTVSIRGTLNVPYTTEHIQYIYITATEANKAESYGIHDTPLLLQINTFPAKLLQNSRLFRFGVSAYGYTTIPHDPDNKTVYSSVSLWRVDTRSGNMPGVKKRISNKIDTNTITFAGNKLDINLIVSTHESISRVVLNGIELFKGCLFGFIEHVYKFNMCVGMAYQEITTESVWITKTGCSTTTMLSVHAMGIQQYGEYSYSMNIVRDSTHHQPINFSIGPGTSRVYMRDDNNSRKNSEIDVAFRVESLNHNTITHIFSISEGVAIVAISTSLYILDIYAVINCGVDVTQNKKRKILYKISPLIVGGPFNTIKYKPNSNMWSINDTKLTGLEYKPLKKLSFGLNPLLESNLDGQHKDYFKSFTFVATLFNHTSSSPISFIVKI